MLTRRIILILVALLIFVVLAGCSSGGETAASTSPTTGTPSPPETAQELLDRAIAWVESQPRKADLGGLSTPYYRAYGEGGLPVLLHIETLDQPYPGPVLFDGETYYLQVLQQGHELEGQWVSVPGELLESEAGRRELGDLIDSITWFWILDPLTGLRAGRAQGDLGPADDGEIWTIKAKLDSGLLARAIPGEWQEREFNRVDDWTIDLRATTDGAIESMTLNVQLEGRASLPWSWSSEPQGPKAPENALPLQEVEQSLR